ncbi:hypothetical protein DPEC_G00205370 [Dallia pectoralis]|uniref:Uncharacterized protein n=1 Tax=Dallia pectoralis TaxID=75939 RepID=A0ACC2G4R8_DALPE|nr:hypothetical protein DPEC_G00205370 [Dallia pectoralis]
MKAYGVPWDQQILEHPMENHVCCDPRSRQSLRNHLVLRRGFSSTNFGLCVDLRMVFKRLLVLLILALPVKSNPLSSPTLTSSVRRLPVLQLASK